MSGELRTYTKVTPQGFSVDARATLPLPPKGFVRLITVTMATCVRENVLRIFFGFKKSRLEVLAIRPQFLHLFDAKDHGDRSKPHLWPVLHVVGGHLRNRHGSLLVLLPAYRLHRTAGDAGFAGDDSQSFEKRPSITSIRAASQIQEFGLRNLSDSHRFATTMCGR